MISYRSDGNAARRYLLNDQLTFAHRLYTEFDVSLKHIKLVKPLYTITNDRTTYLKDTMGADCFTALNHINQLRQATRLRDAKHLNLFPSVIQLLAFEKKFGGFVTDADIDGIAATRSQSV